MASNGPVLDEAIRSADIPPGSAAGTAVLPVEGLDAILFDFDGVLVDSVDIKSRVFCALFADHPDHLDAITALHERHGGLSRLVKFDMIYRDILKVPLTEDHRVRLARHFADLVVEQVIACPMIAGAEAVLRALAPRLPLEVVSGTPEPELREIIARRGLTSYFHGIHGSPRGKAEIIGDLLARFGWRARRVVMVGDALTDHEAAMAHGLPFIGRVPAGQASPFPPGTRLVETLTELAPALTSLYVTDGPTP